MIINGEWFPRNVRFAFAEPVIELVKPKKAPQGLWSDLDVHAVDAVLTLPLTEIQIPARSKMPRGFIYHLPRSGSTLMARMISSVDGNFVLDEPIALNGLLSGSLKCREKFNVAWLTKLLALFANAAHHHHTKLFIKLSSWMSLRINELTLVSPSTRTIFVHRNPIEVIVQVLERSPGWMATESKSLFMSDMKPKNNLSNEDFCAHMLQAFYHSILESDANPLIVNYSDISADTLDKVLKHLGADVTKTLSKEIATDICYYDSDDYSQQTPFVPDEGHLKSIADRTLIKLCEETVQPTFEKLIKE